ncbi:MAG TPA: tyrosine-type recombinase/integrase, partial [Chthoniobacterales bacterium]|nr:tyrosine-type recombinase/integrase [Chthoniobacterales bacterium]
MASLHKDGRGKTPYWIAAYTDWNGKRRKRSTKETSQKEAQKVLNGWLKAIELKRDDRLTESRAREIISEIYGQKIYMPTTEKYFKDWLAAEKPTVSLDSYTKKDQATRLFLESLGDRASKSIEAVTEADIVKFRDELLAAGRRPVTVNQLVRKIIAQPFRAAQKKGYIQIDPVAGLKAVRGDHVEKHVFTAEQVQRLVNTAEGDWKGLVIAGFYTGARLSDLANLTWGNVDLAKSIPAIIFVQKKTGKKIEIPIAEDLLSYLLTLPTSDDPKTPVFPSLYGKTSAGKSGLSMAFGRLMAKAGIDQGVIRERGEGVS